MLVRAARPNFDGFRDAAKQLLAWTCSRKRDFHSTCRSDCNSNYKQERDDIYRDEDNRDGESRDRDTLDRRGGYRGTDFRDGYRDFRGGYRNFKDRGFRFNRRNNFGGKYEMFFDNSKAVFKENELKQFEKNFYTPHPNVVNRPESEIQDFYKKNDIHLFGNSTIQCPRPIFNFNELDLPDGTQEIIRDLNYIHPTPIQSQTWPVALSGLNMVGIAQTGSGKTLGFVLPGLIHIQHQPPLEKFEGPIAVVISPTRELAQQISKVFKPFANSYNLRTACVFGGSSKGEQANDLRGAHVCIGTPGRIIDFIEERVLKLSRCTYFVLDEADRLLDMGFEPQVNAILNKVRPDRQVLMWSATWPKKVEEMALTHLKTYVGVKFGSSELTANPNITQHVHVVDRREKQNFLLKLLNEISGEKTLIFAETKLMVQNLSRFLRRNGFKADFLTSDKTQIMRDRTMNAFRSGRIQILVGTNVISRGLDITDIKYVINYDFPKDIEEYVHVIGRTGRCENRGTAHTLFTNEDCSLAKDLIEILKQTNQEVNPELAALVNRFQKRSIPTRPNLYMRRPMRY